MNKKNSTNLIFERLKLLRLKHFWLYYPNLASEISLSIYPNCNENDITVKLRFEQIGCEMASCNPYYPVLKTCSNEQTPLAFSNSSNEYLVSCQPSCRLLKPHINNLKNGTEIFSPFAVWGDNCYVEDANLLAFIVDYGRRNEFNDNRGLDFKAEIRTDSVGRKYISGRINKSYCEAHGMNYVDQSIDFDYDGIDPPNAKRCDLSGGKYVSTFFIGSSLTRLFSRWYTGKIPNNTKYMSVREKYLSNDGEWKKHRGPYNYELLNPEIEVSDLNIDSGYYWTNKSTLEYKPGSKVNGGYKMKNDRNTDNGTSTYNMFSDDEEEDFSSFNNDTDGKALSDYIDIISQNLYNLYSTLIDKENVANVIIGESGELTLNKIKIHIKSETKNLINYIVNNKQLQTKLIENLGSAITESKIMNKVLVTLITDRIAFSMGRTVAAISKISLAATNVAGWLLIIGPILDIVFSFYDPFKLATEPYSDRILYKIASKFIEQRQRLYNKSNIELDPMVFWIKYVRPTLNKETLYKLLDEEIYTIHKYVVLREKSDNHISNKDAIDKYVNKLLNYSKDLNITSYEIIKTTSPWEESKFLLNIKICYLVVIVFFLICYGFFNLKLGIVSVLTIFIMFLQTYLEKVFLFK